MKIASVRIGPCFNLIPRVIRGRSFGDGSEEDHQGAVGIAVFVRPHLEGWVIWDQRCLHLTTLPSSRAHYDEAARLTII